MIKDWDLWLVPLGFATLATYHGYFLYIYKTQPLLTVIGANHVGRRAWVRSMMADVEKKGVLAVQSLRNSMMGSILWASVAILLCSGSVAFINTSYSYGIRKPVFESFGGGKTKQDETTMSIKVTLLLGCFMVCFFCCMQSVRFLNQVSFFINTPGEEILSKFVTPEYVASLFEKACNFQAAGSRSFYFTIPLILWILGPVPLAMACFVIIPFLYHLDMK
ncbi:hypothetical protein SELMODRAFT_132501 [Selaginella moellendorffii]|uniref:DUF599 domain-containing protein n=1 Tax=Selaginella moellendorffii TaxID=88036 RepID=D8T5G3_SELML|nr:uncharacterized protein LOC9659441 [Selaginella moellendorffii]EFJ08076.1 hypothetical protein SELMODRAFT_132501 [Selaginella moellendorffii]|eukprot:XP_002990803.1 uncharacterized protein LOC9659441 [Selaginella moellendorffii]